MESVSAEFIDKLSECLLRVTYWRGNQHACGSQVILGPMRTADVDTEGGEVPIYTLRRTVIKRGGSERVVYEVIYLDVDRETNEPIPQSYEV
jgi:hypothetical protein